MTSTEIQALREKHRDNGIDERCETCHYVIEIEEANNFEVCTAPPYPCDVIKVLDALEEANFQAAINYERGYDDGFKVLDATENLKFNDLKTKVECDHAIAIALHGTDPVGINFTYCPKCGEKL